MGRASRRFWVESPSATSSAEATLPAMSDWTLKTSDSSASNPWDQRLAELFTWISSGFTRTRFDAAVLDQRTVPVSR